MTNSTVGWHSISLLPERTRIMRLTTSTSAECPPSKKRTRKRSSTSISTAQVASQTKASQLPLATISSIYLMTLAPCRLRPPTRMPSRVAPIQLMISSQISIKISRPQDPPMRLSSNKTRVSPIHLTSDLQTILLLSNRIKMLRVSVAPILSLQFRKTIKTSQLNSTSSSNSNNNQPKRPNSSQIPCSCKETFHLNKTCTATKWVTNSARMQVKWVGRACTAGLRGRIPSRPGSVSSSSLGRCSRISSNSSSNRISLARCNQGMERPAVAMAAA